MFEENRITAFLIGCVVLGFALFNYRQLRATLPDFFLLFLAFLFLFLKELLANFEWMIKFSHVRLVTDSFYFLNILIFVIWLFRVTYRQRSHS